MPRQNWTEDDLTAAKIRMGNSGGVEQMEARQAHNLKVAGSRPAPATNRYAPYKSHLEYKWAHYLDGMKALKLIDGWLYEPMNFRLPGHKNFYKIDFQTWIGQAVTFYEIKGRNKSDDRSLVKLKTASGLHPWAVWIQVKRIDGQWSERKMS